MNLEEIISGELGNPNIPIFSNPKHECDQDGYAIMSDIWNGYYVLGILDNNIPLSYVILEPEQNGLNKLREIYTDPKHRGNNLAAILLLCLKGKLGVRILLDKDEVVSENARGLILKMVKGNRLHASLPDGKKLSPIELENIFNNVSPSNISIIIEGHNFSDIEPKYRKDLILSERFHLRYSNKELFD